MLGDPQNELKGLIPRAIESLFQSLSREENCSYAVHFAYVQIYMELIQDLLNPENRVKIREDSTEGCSLVGLTWRAVHSLADCLQVLEAGNQARNTAFTSLNASSSRSHAVVFVRVEKLAGEHVLVSTLQLVDLAGSERLSTFNSPGIRLDESKAIGLSLLSLGNCIKSLSDKRSKHVSYRDSVLTRLLSHALSGNACISFILTISPSAAHSAETLQTLSFGFSALKVETHPTVSKRIDYKSLCSKLQTELEQSKNRYTALAAANGKLEMLLKQVKSALYTQQREDFEDQIAEKVTRSLKDQYEVKLREKDNAYTKLLVDFNQFISTKDLEMEKIKREKAGLYETLQKIQQEKGGNCTISMCSHATELFALTEELELIKSQKNTQKETILELETNLESCKNEILALKKQLEDGEKSIKPHDETGKMAELSRKVELFEANSTSLSSQLFDLESAYNEKCEETELLRAELMRRNAQKGTSDSKIQRKELESEIQYRKKLELQVTQLRWEITRLEKGDRTHVKLVKALLAHIKDLATYSVLEAALHRIFKQNGENSLDNVRVFADDFHIAMNKEAKGMVNSLKEEAASLKDQLKIATQLYESQRDQCSQLVKYSIDRSIAGNSGELRTAARDNHVSRGFRALQ
jgi:kinesin family protein 5